MMKLFFIGSAGYVVYLMKVKFRWVLSSFFSGSATAVEDATRTRNVSSFQA